MQARDRAGNIASETLPVIIDGSPPVLTYTLSSQVPYSHAGPETVYYGVGSGAFTVTAAAYDALSGLNVLTFPTTVAPGQVHSLQGVNTATLGQRYAFDPTDTFAGPATVG